ncbi:MAG: 50S ribosomal protein L10 [Candidatus Zixiibacteriota bacterium]
MPNLEKKQEIEHLTGLLNENEVFYLADYRGLTVEQFETLRNELRKTGITVRVAKNRLLKRAWEFEDKEKLESYLHEPTAVILAGSDPVTPAKVIKEFHKENELPKVKAILVEKDIYDGELTFDKFASMDSPEELRGKLVNVLASPMTGFLGIFSSLQRNLVYALGQIKDKKEQNN